MRPLPQMPTPGRRTVSSQRPELSVTALAGALACACIPLAPMPVSAQEAARSSSLSTTLDTTLTYLESKREDGFFSGSDLITEVRPGLRYASRAGRLRGSASYGLGLLLHSNGSPSSEVQHRLSANLTGELIERRAFIDVTASIAKQALSAYGQQSIASNRADNANLAEVGNLSVSPYVTGALGGVATYSLRLNASATNARTSIAGDSTTMGGSLAINSASRGAMVGWGLNVSSTTTDFRAGTESTSQRAVASIKIAPDVDWAFTLRGGQESTDIGALRQQSYSTWGASVRWQPSLRTTADISADSRFFGRSHSVTLAHRFPLSSLRFTSARDITLSSNPAGLGRPQTLYQLFFEQFTSIEPDPILRDQRVLAFLAGQGQDPNATVGGGFVTPGASLQQRQDIAWSFAAKRLTLALQAFANRSGLIGGTSVTPTGEDVRQRGYNSTLSYRLTRTASFGINGSRLMTRPTSVQPGTDLKSLSLTFSNQLGRRTTGALSARYSVFNSAFNPYRESAVTASLAMRF
ncbi:MAG: TIGR03016 family PEP-CTERM system-associated outer membrane protein [Leptothrix sp. (in: Bacteria)]|nr:TIGR03016 family PEP-CTERM system-associated outer membrane protein [Leptothrix sp. (in: b-proteobacteria)]